MEAQRDKLATVAGKITMLATADVQPTSFVALSVQHDARGAASRAGPSAAADTCDKIPSIDRRRRTCVTRRETAKYSQTSPVSVALRFVRINGHAPR